MTSRIARAVATTLGELLKGELRVVITPHGGFSIVVVPSLATAFQLSQVGKRRGAPRHRSVAV